MSKSKHDEVDILFKPMTNSFSEFKLILYNQVLLMLNPKQDTWLQIVGPDR